MKRIFIMTGLLFILGTGLTAQAVITKKVKIEKGSVTLLPANKIDVSVKKPDSKVPKNLIRKKLLVHAVKESGIYRNK